MQDYELLNTLAQLARSSWMEPESIQALAASGSPRKYFRISAQGQSIIGAYNANVEENESFFYLSEHFGSLGLSVPKILAINSERDVYLQTDLGDVTLFHHIQRDLTNGKYSESTIALIKETLRHLVRFQIEGHQGLDYNKVYPSPCFDKQGVIEDLDYFKYYFVKPHSEIVFNEMRLNKEFKAFAEQVGGAANDYFMYRDFQSRNVMINQGAPCFIDYQGGRKGPLQYDVVSLLYQVKAQMPQDLRDKLLEYYKEELSKRVNLAEIGFDQYYPYFVYLRLMQVLGAYGFRGLIQKKAHFMESIPYALEELANWSEKHALDTYPELQNVLEQLRRLREKYPTPARRNANTPQGLTLTVNSFSFRKGYPVDLSGNGGGFVFDCRALPNPGREPEFKTKTGRDWEVAEYLLAKPQTHLFLDHVKGLVQQSIENYLERHFSNLTVSFGCTGGQHRSVFFAQSLAEWAKARFPEINVSLNHIEQHIHE